MYESAKIRRFKRQHYCFMDVIFAMKIMNKEFEKGISYLKSAEYQKALEVFNTLVDKDPSNAAYYSERGVVHFHLSKKHKSLHDMDKAVELEPQKSYRYSSRAYIRGHYGMIEEAIEDYQKAVDLDPEDAVAHNNLGLLLEQRGYKKYANLSFQKADELADIAANKGRTDIGVRGEEIQFKNLQKEIDAEAHKSSMLTELKKLFTKEGRSSFLQFLKSGLRLKEEE